MPHIDPDLGIRRLVAVARLAWIAEGGQALADADTFFGHELPGLRQWTFGPEQARRITQPVLAVVGENSGASV
jgi:hypothetical protein